MTINKNNQALALDEIARLTRVTPGRQTLSHEMMTNFFEEYYWVYVLLSLKDGKKYTGYTKNLPSRFEAHQKGEVKSTKQYSS